MSKIKDLLSQLSEVNWRDRPVSPTMQRIMKATAEMEAQDGFSLANKLSKWADALAVIKKEAQGLDNKTSRKLDDMLLEIKNLAFKVKKVGVSAVESHED